MAPARTDISATIDKEDEEEEEGWRELEKLTAKEHGPISSICVSRLLSFQYSFSLQYASSSNTSLCIMSLTSFGFYLCQILAPSS